MHEDWVDFHFRAPEALKARAIARARQDEISLDAYVRLALHTYLVEQCPARMAGLPDGRVLSEPKLPKGHGRVWSKFPASWLPVVDSLLVGGLSTRAAVVRDAIHRANNVATPGVAQAPEVP